MNLKEFLKDSDHIVNSNTHLLSTQSSDSNIIYKNKLNNYVKNNIIINKNNNIQNKINSKTISKSNLIDPSSM